MRRITATIGALALVVAACSGSASPSPTLAPTTPAPTATPAPSTAAPSASPVAQLTAAVTFDGKACTYAGPSVIPRGAAVTFSLTNTAAATADGLAGGYLLVMPVRDGTTWETIVAYLKDHHVAEIPDWARISGVADDGTAEAQIMYPAAVQAGDTMKVVMTRNLYYVMCGTPPPADRGFPAVLLKVRDA